MEKFDLQEENKNLKATLSNMLEVQISPPLIMMPGSECEKLNNSLKQENSYLKEELAQYKNIFGCFYIKKKTKINEDI